MLKRFENITPHPALSGLVDKIWILETTGRVEHVASKVIIPNGNAKIILPFKNQVITSSNQRDYLSKDNVLSFTGISDVPFYVDAKDSSASGTIGFELTPIGLQRLLNINQCELQNKLIPLAEILPAQISELEEQLVNLDSAESKINFFQNYLLKKLFSMETDPVFEYCIRRIKESQGRITVEQLQRATGFSSRWLLTKFKHHLGISPKNYCAIVRFNFVYRNIFVGLGQATPDVSLYDHYYDQSHLIKDFRRFTGTIPSAFNDGARDFGKIFFKK